MIAKSEPISSSRSYSRCGIIAVARSSVLPVWRVQKPGIATRRRLRSATLEHRARSWSPPSPRGTRRPPCRRRPCASARRRPDRTRPSGRRRRRSGGSAWREFPSGCMVAVTAHYVPPRGGSGKVVTLHVPPPLSGRSGGGVFGISSGRRSPSRRRRARRAVSRARCPSAARAPCRARRERSRRGAGSRSPT